MKLLHYVFAVIGLVAVTGITHASDHLDAPLVSLDGRLDVNDSYIFQSPNDSERSVMIMTVNPGAGIFSPMTFHPTGTYEFNIDNTGDAVPEITYSVQFGRPSANGSQRYTVRRNRALVARGRTGTTARIRVGGPGSVTCGQFDDPFFFDLNGFNNGFQFTGDDFFAGLNVSAIVIEVSTSALTQGSSGSVVSLSCRTRIGPEQIDRVGRPAINTALIPSDLKDAFNVGLPVNDPEDFGATVQASIESLNGGDSQTAEFLTGILLPDVLTVDLGNPAGFLNGRGLADDVIDATLELVTNGAVASDFADANDIPFLDTFPYLGPPHQ